MKKLVCLAVLVLAASGCPKKEKKSPKATKAGGTIEAKSGSGVHGSVTFEPSGDGRMKVTVSIEGATPGDHGVHIHETGDCSAPDASSAGGHFNPTQAEHGAPGAPQHHLGDLGNISVSAGGTGSMTITVKGLTIDDKKTGVVGRALIVHDRPDDMTTQPTGGAGNRIGCAVIKAM